MPPSDDERLVDALPALVLLVQGDLRAERGNVRWTEYTGMPVDVTSVAWAEAIHPEDRPHVLDLVPRLVATKGSGDVEVRLRRADGAFCWFALRIAPQPHWLSPRSLLVFFDITAAREREQRLTASEREARDTFNFVPALIVKMRPSGELESANQPLIDRLGQTLDELKEWGSNGTVHPEDIERVGQVWGRALANGEPYDLEHRIRCHDGEYRWFHVCGYPQRDAEAKVVCWYVAISDIDAQKVTEDRLRRSEASLSLSLAEQTSASQALQNAVSALRLSEQELNLIIETMPAYVWCASPDGAISYVNRRVLNLLGVPHEQVVDRWAQLIHPDERDSAVRAWAKAVASGEAYSLSLRLRLADGAYHWMQTMGQLGRDEFGAPARWYGLLIDIDEQRRTEEALKDTRARLARAARIATVAELSASIAHEVNQPLSAIVSNAQACVNWLNASPPKIDRARAAAETIVRDGAQAGETIARLRNLFQRQPVKRVALSINQLISDVVQLVLAEAGQRQVTVETALEPTLPAVPGDRVQLQQVVLNLLNNALDAVEGFARRERVVVVRSSMTPEAILVEVDDSGIGLSDPTKVFEPFFTTKAHGLGIGLAICRWVVDGHGGKLWAQNHERHGASFFFSLPLEAGS